MPHVVTPICLDVHPVEDLAVIVLKGVGSNGRTPKYDVEWLHRALCYREFVSLSRSSKDSVSIVIGASFLKQAALPKNTEVQRDWVSLKIDKAGLDATTKLCAFSALRQMLHYADVDARAVSTLESDHLILRENSLRDAVAVLLKAGHAIRPARRLCPLLPADMIRKSDRCRVFAGAWRLVRRERAEGLPVQEFTQDHGPVRLQSACGLFADVCVSYNRCRSFDAIESESSCAGFVEMAPQSPGTGCVGKSEISRHRLIDFQPPTGECPKATVSLDGQLLQESGVPDDRYQETWARLDPSQDCVVLELVSETPNRGAKRYGCWLFCGSHFTRVVGLSTGQGLVSGTCSVSLRQLQQIHGEGAISAELTKHYEAEFGFVERPGVLKIKRQAWAAYNDKSADVFYDAENGKGGRISVPNLPGGDVLHKLPDGTAQQWRVLEWSFDPFTPKATTGKTVKVSGGVSDAGSSHSVKSAGSGSSRRKKKVDKQKKLKKGKQTQSSNSSGESGKDNKKRSRSRSGSRKKKKQKKQKENKSASPSNAPSRSARKKNKRSQSSSSSQKRDPSGQRAVKASRSQSCASSRGGVETAQALSGAGRITINFSKKTAEDPAARESNEKMLKKAEEHANKFAAMDAVLKLAGSRSARKDDLAPVVDFELLRVLPGSQDEDAPSAAKTPGAVSKDTGPLVATSVTASPALGPSTEGAKAEAQAAANVASVPQLAKQDSEKRSADDVAAAPQAKTQTAVADSKEALPVDFPFPKGYPPPPDSAPPQTFPEDFPFPKGYPPPPDEKQLPAHFPFPRGYPPPDPNGKDLPAASAPSAGFPQMVLVPGPGGVAQLAPPQSPQGNLYFDPSTGMLVHAVPIGNAKPPPAPLNQQHPVSDAITRWMTENGVDNRAKTAMAHIPPDLQQKVIAEGPLTGTNHSAMLVARIRKVEPAAKVPSSSVAAVQAQMAVPQVLMQPPPTQMPGAAMLPPGVTFPAALPPGMLSGLATYGPACLASSVPTMAVAVPPGVPPPPPGTQTGVSATAVPPPPPG